MDTLVRLQSELEQAREQYQLAQYIDSTVRMQQQQAYWSKRIAVLKEQIAEFEADD